MRDPAAAKIPNLSLVEIVLRQRTGGGSLKVVARLEPGFNLGV